MKQNEIVYHKIKMSLMYWKKFFDQSHTKMKQEKMDQRVEQNLKLMPITLYILFW